MTGQVKVFAQACIDPRFRFPIETFIQKKFQVKPTEYDLKTDAGGIREIALKTAVGDWLITNARIAHDKHGVRTFVLCNHMDCAYYGGSGSFPGVEEERLAYELDLKSAAGILGQQFPDVRIYVYLVSKEEKPKERFIFQQVV